MSSCTPVECQRFLMFARDLGREIVTHGSSDLRKFAPASKGVQRWEHAASVFRDTRDESGPRVPHAHAGLA